MATSVAVSIINYYRILLILRPQWIYDKMIYLQRNGIQSQQILINTK